MDFCLISLQLCLLQETHTVETKLGGHENGDTGSNEDEQDGEVGECPNQNDKSDLPGIPLLTPLLQVCYVFLHTREREGEEDIMPTHSSTHQQLAFTFQRCPAAKERRWNSLHAMLGEPQLFRCWPWDTLATVIPSDYSSNNHTSCHSIHSLWGSPWHSLYYYQRSRVMDNYAPTPKPLNYTNCLTKTVWRDRVLGRDGGKTKIGER